MARIISTYRHLLEEINKLDEKQLDSQIVIMDSENEYVPVEFQLAEEVGTDVLEDGHPFLVLGSHEIVETF